MAVFRYSNPPVIYWGRQSLGDQLPSELRRLGSRGPVIVTTKSLLEEARRLPLRPADSPVTVVISQHAPMREIELAIHDAEEADVDGVVSFGGGSPIDAAKILAV